MTLNAYQKEVDDWIQQHGVRYFHEMTNLGLLMEEVGELARLLTRTAGEQSFKTDAEPADVHAEISDEMADVLFVLTCLANQSGVNLETALLKNLEKKRLRDAQRHHDNPKLRE